ncbi:hypothetical protein EDB89DRAFT_1911906 [Lactarius sanguifluus]|nr:hypothetical protein EDB89DRAFT_1911906 [Lactarius sanguifluus]
MAMFGKFQVHAMVITTAGNSVAGQIITLLSPQRTRKDHWDLEVRGWPGPVQIGVRTRTAPDRTRGPVQVWVRFTAQLGGSGPGCCCRTIDTAVAVTVSFVAFVTVVVTGAAGYGGAVEWLGVHAGHRFQWDVGDGGRISREVV